MTTNPTSVKVTEIGDTVVVVGAARTAIGSFGGVFRETPAHVLAATAIRGALERGQTSGEEVDDVVLGCIGQVGPDICNARRASLEAGMPPSVPAYNVNRLCGSGLQAIWNAALELRSGESDVVVAGGNENMSLQPFLDFGARGGYKLGDRRMMDGTMALVTDPWGNYPMGVTAEIVAERFGVSRKEQDEFALNSQKNAEVAIARGLFVAEIVPVSVRHGVNESMVAEDEHPRPSVTLDKLAALKPAFREGGSVTAGNSSGINDGAAAVVMMRESTARARHIPALVRLVGFAKTALEPEVMGYAPTMAIERVLKRTGLTIDTLDVVELNEAFAAQAVAVIRDGGLDATRVNPNGGAIALGHPVGATGAILTVKLIHDMLRRNLEWGMVTMCIGGGQALAGVFQRV